MCRKELMGQAQWRETSLKVSAILAKPTCKVEAWLVSKKIEFGEEGSRLLEKQNQ